MSTLISRISSAQFFCFVAALLFALCAYALRPLPNLANTDAETVARSLIAQDLQYADLTEAIGALQSAGFIKLKDDANNTLAASALHAGANGSALGVAGASPLPSVIAIVRARGVWQAYFRLDGELIISAANENVGDWLVKQVSQGEIVLSNGDITEIIDIFGAEEESSQEQ